MYINSACVTLDSNENAVAVWSHSDEMSHSIWSNRYVTGTGWGTAELIETGTGNAACPRLAADNSGNVVVVWQQRDGTRYDIWSNWYIAGNGWGTPELIETDNAGDATYAHVSADSSGDAVAVWEQFDGSYDSIWSNQYVTGSGWSTAELIETGSANARDSKVTMDNSGNAIAVWDQWDGTHSNIWSNRYVSGIGWGTAELIETNNIDDAIFPEIAGDGSGNAIAVWQQGDDIFTDCNIWSNRYVTGTGWGTAELIEAGAGHAEFPELAVDNRGNAIAVWCQWDGSYDSIWSNRYDPGSGWGSAELIETCPGTAFNPHVAVNGNGNAVAVWHQHIGTYNNIYSNHYTPESGWGTAELIETYDAGDAEYPWVAVNGNGNAVAVWQQWDPFYNIWSNRYE